MLDIQDEPGVRTDPQIHGNYRIRVSVDSPYLICDAPLLTPSWDLQCLGNTHLVRCWHAEHSTLRIWAYSHLFAWRFCWDGCCKIAELTKSPTRDESKAHNIGECQRHSRSPGSIDVMLDCIHQLPLPWLCNLVHFDDCGSDSDILLPPHHDQVQPWSLTI